VSRSGKGISSALIVARQRSCNANIENSVPPSFDSTRSQNFREVERELRHAARLACLEAVCTFPGGNIDSVARSLPFQQPTLVSLQEDLVSAGLVSEEQFLMPPPPALLSSVEPTEVGAALFPGASFEHEGSGPRGR